jgi:hypothetical protein
LTTGRPATVVLGGGDSGMDAGQSVRMLGLPGMLAMSSNSYGARIAGA